MKISRNIYFVRHGQTDANVGDYPQANESKLTLCGHNQAKVVADRVSKLSIDGIYTSPLQRAQETAEHISNALGLDYKTLDLLSERKKPSDLIGLSRHKGKGKEIYAQIEANWGKNDWHYSDEENFDDLYIRIEALIDYLENNTQGNILCVTHGYILRLIVCFLITRSRDSEHYLQATKSLKFENTGITHAYIEGQNSWHFGSINDSTHLS
ncbi:MAG: histidine phosphatase family protein [Patescibacteria group bacterium]